MYKVKIIIINIYIGTIDGLLTVVRRFKSRYHGENVGPINIRVKQSLTRVRCIIIYYACVL